VIVSHSLWRVVCYQKGRVSRTIAVWSLLETVLTRLNTFGLLTEFTANPLTWFCRKRRSGERPERNSGRRLLGRLEKATCGSEECVLHHVLFFSSLCIFLFWYILDSLIPVGTREGFFVLSGSFYFFMSNHQGLFFLSDTRDRIGYVLWDSSSPNERLPLMEPKTFFRISVKKKPQLYQIGQLFIYIKKNVWISVEDYLLCTLLFLSLVQRIIGCQIRVQYLLVSWSYTPVIDHFNPRKRLLIL
jgi:hypothetical protein